MGAGGSSSQQHRLSEPGCLPAKAQRVVGGRRAAARPHEAGRKLLLTAHRCLPDPFPPLPSPPLMQIPGQVHALEPCCTARSRRLWLGEDRRPGPSFSSATLAAHAGASCRHAWPRYLACPTAALSCTLLRFIPLLLLPSLLPPPVCSLLRTPAPINLLCQVL